MPGAFVALFQRDTRNLMLLGAAITSGQPRLPKLRNISFYPTENPAYIYSASLSLVDVPNDVKVSIK